MMILLLDLWRKFMLNYCFSILISSKWNFNSLVDNSTRYSRNNKNQLFYRIKVGNLIFCLDAITCKYLLIWHGTEI